MFVGKFNPFDECNIIFRMETGPRCPICQFIDFIHQIFVPICWGSILTTEGFIVEMCQQIMHMTYYYTGVNEYFYNIHN